MAARTRGGLLSPTAYLRSAGLAKGIRGGNPAWRNVFIALTVARLVRRSAGRTTQVLTRDKLKPGQSIVVTTVAPKVMRATQKAAAAEIKAARSAAERDAKAAKQAAKTAKRERKQANQLARQAAKQSS